MYVVKRLLDQRFGENRYLTLLASLILLLLLYPIMQELDREGLWGLFFTAELLLAVYSISMNKRTLAVAVLLLTPAVAAELTDFFVSSRETHWFSAISVVVFLGYVIFVVYRSVLAPGRVTGDRIAGAISVYLLLGLLWSVVYGIIAAVDPQAFSGIELARSPEEGAKHGLLYFSFVTLTTLGYGDITPLTPVPRMLAWMEAVSGQLFLAISIARLVALQISHSVGTSLEE